MNNMFTDGVKRVMQYAREESARLGHNYIGTEHLLLGIIKEGKGKAVTVLTNLGLNLETVKQSVEDYVATSGGTMTIGEVPFTPRAKQILEVAANAPHITHFYFDQFYGEVFYGGKVAVRIKELVRLRLSRLHGCAL